MLKSVVGPSSSTSLASERCHLSVHCCKFYWKYPSIVDVKKRTSSTLSERGNNFQWNGISVKEFIKLIIIKGRAIVEGILSEIVNKTEVNRS